MEQRSLTAGWFCMGVDGVIASLLVVAGAGAWAVFTSSHTWSVDRRRRIWTEFATRRGGTFREEQPQGWGRGPVMSVEVPSGAAVVRMDLQQMGQAHTRVRARQILGGGPHFWVRPLDAVERAARSLVVYRLKMDQAAFDQALIVIEGDDPVAIRGMWSERACNLAAQHVDQGWVASAKGMITLMVPGERTMNLDALVDVVGELASAGSGALDAFADLPHAAWVPAGGTWKQPVPPSLEFGTPNGPVRAAPRVLDGRLCVRLEMSVPRSLPTFDVVAGDARLPPGLLTDVGARAMAQLAGLRVECKEQRLTLQWTGMPSKAELAAGVALLADMAGSTLRSGPFR